MEKIPTPKELMTILKRLTPQQRKLGALRISEAFVKARRSQLKLVRGGRHDKRSLLARDG